MPQFSIGWPVHPLGKDDSASSKMDDFATRYLAAMLGSLAAGFLRGALAWFATNFWGRPISKFPDLRLQAQETILFHANVGPYLADAERMPKASEDLRRIAAQIGGIT